MTRTRLAVGLAVFLTALGVTGWTKTHTSFEKAYVMESCGKCYEGIVEPEPQSPGSPSDPESQSTGSPDNPGVLVGPGDGDGDESGGDADWAHAFGSIWWDPGIRKICEGCNACHRNSQPGRCSQFHCDCSGSGVDAKTLDARIARTIEAGAVADLQALLSRHGDVVAYDPTDGTVVLRDCEMAEVKRLVLPERLKAMIKST